MQIEELKQHWQQLDQKLDYSLNLQTDLLRRIITSPARRRVHRLAIWPAIDIGFCVGALLLVGSFLGNYWRDWLFVVPSAGIMIAALVLLIDSFRQLSAVTQVDWSGPVSDIQSSLERLRLAKIRQFKWIILLSPLVGFCVMLVGVQGLFDFNFFEKISPWWVVSNYAFGVLFIPLGYTVARFLEQRFHGHHWWQNVIDDISGKSLKAAAQELERWASLQRETSNNTD